MSTWLRSTKLLLAFLGAECLSVMPKLEQKSVMVLPTNAEWLSVKMVFGTPKRQQISCPTFCTTYCASVEGTGKISTHPEKRSLTVNRYWQPLITGLIGPTWSRAMQWKGSTYLWEISWNLLGGKALFLLAHPSQRSRMRGKTWCMFLKYMYFLAWRMVSCWLMQPYTWWKYMSAAIWSANGTTAALTGWPPGVHRL